MKRRTTLNLDTDLISEAQEALGTSSVTETIHTALREAIALSARRRLLEYDFSELTPEALEEMRRGRVFPEVESVNS